MPANENMNWTMNHELVHIAATDRAAGSDRFFRGLFQGKVIATSDQPETILYYYLTTPRASAPRWYHEGIAVFVETWMAGGRGRAQSPYDEMVLRSMVRDGSRFYDPLGLVSEGTKIDFQVEANSYLYGARFMSYLAYRYSPGVPHALGGPRPGEQGLLRVPVPAGLRPVPGGGLAGLDRVGARVPDRRTWRRIRLYPTTPLPGPRAPGPGRGVAGVPRPDGGSSTPAFNYPGVVAHVGAISLEDGSVEKIRDVKDPEHYIVTSLAYDPGAEDALLHDRQLRLPRPPRPRPETKQARAAHEGRAHRRPRVQPGRPLALGRAPLQRRRDPRAHPAPLPRMEAGPLVALRRGDLRPRHLAGRRACSASSTARSAAASRCG